MTKDIKTRVMKRVYAIWFLKKVAPALFLYAPFLLFVALREVAREFFVLKIMDNFLTAIHGSGFYGGVRFIASAIENVHVVPTIVIISSLGLCGWLLVRLAKNFSRLRLTKGWA